MSNTEEESYMEMEDLRAIRKQSFPGNFVLKINNTGVAEGSRNSRGIGNSELELSSPQEAEQRRYPVTESVGICVLLTIIVLCSVGIGIIVYMCAPE